MAVTPFATAGADTSAPPTSAEATGGPSRAARLSAADDIAPNADPEPGTLVINAGGDRVGGAIAGASGAVFSIFTDAALTVPATPATCGPTDANGVCSVSLPPGTFYAVETTAPPGYQTLPQLATDPNDTTRDYTNSIGPFTITSGSTLTIPDNTGLSTTDFNYSSGKYANRRVNPPLLSACGFNIALLFDMSGSIDDTEFGQMKDAAKDFATTLGGTPSAIGLYPFATAAPAAGNTNLAATSVATAAGVTTVTDAIDNLVKPSGVSRTNWDSALAQIPSGYDLVLVLTDGNPTVDSTSISPSGTNFARIENGVASANRVKTLASGHGTNTRVLGIGIGISPASLKNLAAVSGPTEFTGSNAATADYFTTGFDSLGDTLAAIIEAQCVVDLVITKSASQPAVSVGQPFSYTLAVDDLGPANAAVDAAVIDVLPANVSLVSFAVPAGVVCNGPVGRTISCTIPKDLLEVTDPPVSLTVNVTVVSTPQTLPMVNKVIVTSPDDEAPCAVTTSDITCNPANTNNYDDVSVGFTSLSIVKDAQPNTTTPFQFTVTGGVLPSSFSLVDDGTDSNRRSLGNIVAGQQYVITELEPADDSYAVSAISCSGGGTGSTVVALARATLTLAPGDQVVCTFVNGTITPGGLNTRRAAAEAQALARERALGCWHSRVPASGGSSSLASCSSSWALGCW